MKKNFCDIFIGSVWILFTALYFYQFYLIYTYSIDIPFKDDWLYLKPDFPLCLPDHFSFKWLFARVTEHHIATTNLMTWFNFKLFQLDYVKYKIINYLLFGVLLLAIIHLKNKIIGVSNFRIFPLFMLFLLSPIAVENHSWAFQSQIHLVLLFFILMLIHSCGKIVSTKKTVLFLIASGMAIFSFAAGVILALTCLFFRNLQILKLTTADKSLRKKGLLNIAVSTIIITGVIFLWSNGYEKPAFLPPRVWPDDIAFWDYFLNLLSFGFGIDTQNMTLGIVILLLVMLPLLLIFVDKKRLQESNLICISAGIIGILAVLMSISFGRASIGYSKTSRYVEISFLLIPFVSMAWWLFLKNSPVKKVCISFLWVVCFSSYWDNWTLAQYVETYETDKNVLDCVTAYYTNGGDAACQDHYITSAHLENASKLQINFTRKFRKKIPQ